MNGSAWQALAWSVAAAITARVDVLVRLAEPDLDGYTGLFIGRRSTTVDQDHVELVQDGPARYRDPIGILAEHPSFVWADLAAGRAHVGTVAQALAQHLSSKSTVPAPAHRTMTYRTIAGVLAQSALHGLDVNAAPAGRLVADIPTFEHPGRYAYQSVYTSYLVDIASPPGPGCAEALKHWILTAHGEAGDIDICLVDTDGYVHLPDSATAGALDLTQVDTATAGWELLALPLGTTTMASRISMIVRGHVSSHNNPPFGLSMLLSAFNRKERFFVFLHATGADVADALHAPSIALSARARRELGASIGTRIPDNAFAAVDYHLNWLHAALQWHTGQTSPTDSGPFPLRASTSTDSADPVTHVDGTQEDIDLLVAWADERGDHVLVVEAKAYGSWGNAQWRSKLNRLTAIRTAAPDVDLRFVLTSPRPPQKLASADELPSWAVPVNGQHGTPTWTRLPAPALRVKTTRCTPTGSPSKDGDHWRITNPGTD